MDKTININLAGTLFKIDEEAIKFCAIIFRLLISGSGI